RDIAEARVNRLTCRRLLDRLDRHERGGAAVTRRAHEVNRPAHAARRGACRSSLGATGKISPLLAVKPGRITGLAVITWRILFSPGQSIRATECLSTSAKSRSARAKSSANILITNF